MLSLTLSGRVRGRVAIWRSSLRLLLKSLSGACCLIGFLMAGMNRRKQGLHILEATLAVYLSAALGRTVGLPIEPGHPVYERGVAGLRELDLPDWSPIRRRRLFGVQ